MSWIGNPYVGLAGLAVFAIVGVLLLLTNKANKRK